MAPTESPQRPKRRPPVLFLDHSRANPNASSKPATRSTAQNALPTPITATNASSQSTNHPQTPNRKLAVPQTPQTPDGIHLSPSNTAASPPVVARTQNTPNGNSHLSPSKAATPSPFPAGASPTKSPHTPHTTVSLSRMNRALHVPGLCEPNPIDPDRVPCHEPIHLDDRQGISHFFGRNKRCTATIPVSCYPLQCRAHYQERKYRMRETPGLEAGQQCDAIMVTLERMSELTWTDEEGNVWPWFVGVELQMAKGGADADADADEEVGTPASTPRIILKPKSKAKGKGKAKSTAEEDNTPTTPNALNANEATTTPKTPKSRNVQPPPVIPAWLLPLLSSSSTATTPHGTSQPHTTHLGTRGGARYTLPQLARIVRSLKTWCLENDSPLPPIEALPVTLGLLAELDVAEAKNRVEGRKREVVLARGAVREAGRRVERGGGGAGDGGVKAKEINKVKVERLQREVEAKEDALERVKEELKEKLEELEKTRGTLPGKRVTKKGEGRKGGAVKVKVGGKGKGTGKGKLKSVVEEDESEVEEGEVDVDGDVDMGDA